MNKSPINYLFKDYSPEALAIECIKCHSEMKIPLHLAFSGGKDSIVVWKLMELSGVEYTGHYYNTSIDPPDLRDFIKENYPGITIHPPLTSMSKVILKEKCLPMQQSRFCCRYLKEPYGDNHMVITGVRAAESRSRAKRNVFSQCFSGRRRWLLNPILSWSDFDVWYFIDRYKLPYFHLYDKGFKRIGCIGCPCATKFEREKQFSLYPKFQLMYENTLDRLIALLKNSGKIVTWENGKAALQWWLSNRGGAGKNSVQRTLFD